MPYLVVEFDCPMEPDSQKPAATSRSFAETVSQSLAPLSALVSARDKTEAWYALGTYLVLAWSVVSAFQVFAVAFDRPILGHHDFRQTQTALSSLMIAKGGPWLKYETPVFGAPYAIPFEFPLYQWLTVLLHWAGVPLDQAGRYVSIAFFLLLFIPLFRLLRSFAFSVNACLLTISGLLTAPLYMFWTRAFMIESTALCLAIATLAVGVDALRDLERPRLLIWLLSFASLAMLVKGTTGIVYLGILSLLIVEGFIRDRDRLARIKAYGLLTLSGVGVPLLLGLTWTRYGDLLKSQNALTANFLSPEALRDWIYGTPEQKLSLATWSAFWDRTSWYGFGTAVTMSAGLALAIFGSRRPWPLVACLLGVLGAFAVFTNLHWFHDYYQYSTTILVIIGVGFGYAAVESWTPRARVLLPIFAALCVYKALAAYDADYRQVQLGGDLRIVELGKFIQAHTRESALIVLYGNDWSSVIPYYAQRKALTNRWNYPPDHPDVQRSLQASATLGNQVEAVLFCYGDRAYGDGRAEALLHHPPSCSQHADCDVCL